MDVVVNKSETPVIRLKKKVNYGQRKQISDFYKVFLKIFNSRLLPPPETDKNYRPSLDRLSGYAVVSQTPYAWVSVYYIAAYTNTQINTVIKRAKKLHAFLKYDKDRQAIRLNRLDSYILINDHWHYLPPELQQKGYRWL